MDRHPLFHFFFNMKGSFFVIDRDREDIKKPCNVPQKRLNELIFLDQNRVVIHILVPSIFGSPKNPPFEELKDVYPMVHRQYELQRTRCGSCDTMLKGYPIYQVAFRIMAGTDDSENAFYDMVWSLLCHSCETQNARSLLILDEAHDTQIIEEELHKMLEFNDLLKELKTFSSSCFHSLIQKLVGGKGKCIICRKNCSRKMFWFYCCKEVCDSVIRTNSQLMKNLVQKKDLLYHDSFISKSSK
jgi:hypothetical protein